MPTLTPVQTYAARYSLIQAELPEHGLVTLGVLLQDTERDQLHLRLRRDVDALAGEDADVLSALAEDLSDKAGEMGAERLFAHLEDSLSNTVRITDREPVLVHNFEWSLNRLFRLHVQSKVREYETHLPKYSLRAAAGRFLENEEVIEEGWEEIPQSLRQTLYEDMFVAHIAGHSMEPKIPDGSLCVFRAGVMGSRTGRLVLAEDRSIHGFSVKRYKRVGDAVWLESLNPEFPSWRLDPEEDKYRILAEFICVLG